MKGFTHPDRMVRRLDRLPPFFRHLRLLLGAEEPRRARIDSVKGSTPVSARELLKLTAGRLLNTCF